MAWSITEYPALNDADKAYISQWLEEYYGLMEQARSDRSRYSIQAAMGNLTALYYYSRAVSTIESLQSEFSGLRLSDPIWREGESAFSIWYNQYFAEFEHLKVFIKTGYGDNGDNVYELSADWADYTLQYLGGNDHISVADGGHRVFVHLGDGDDVFIGNAGGDGT